MLDVGFHFHCQEGPWALQSSSVVSLRASFFVSLKTLLIGRGEYHRRSSQVDIGWLHFHPSKGNPHPLTESLMALM